MTEFEKKVLREVLKIPLGKVRTYKWIAQKIGYPKAYRAVGNVLKKNPFPIFIPCHRVVKSVKKNKFDLSCIGGYSLGRDLKRKILLFEKEIATMIK